MFLIVGLGNPGKKYEKTRHNIGSMVIDKLKLLNSQEIVLVKPSTFMNESGQAVKKLVKNWKIEIKDLVVLHDDLDLVLGKIKIVKNRGAAGHKGVESIIKEIGTKNFIRIRIGIQPRVGKLKNPEKFVLQNFRQEEEKVKKEVIKKTVEAIETGLKEGLEKAMNKYNRS